DGADLAVVCGLLKERAQTLNELAEQARIFYVSPPSPRTGQATADFRAQWDIEVSNALGTLAEKLESSDWNREAIAGALRSTLAEHGLKMPQLAVPVRLLVFGVAQTPSVDAMLAAMPRQAVVARLR